MKEKAGAAADGWSVVVGHVIGGKKYHGIYRNHVFESIENEQELRPTVFRSMLKIITNMNFLRLAHY